MTISTVIRSVGSPGIRTMPARLRRYLGDRRILWLIAAAAFAAGKAPGRPEVEQNDSAAEVRQPEGFPQSVFEAKVRHWFRRAVEDEVLRRFLAAGRRRCGQHKGA